MQEAQAYADEENLLFLETSAKDSRNVSELFTLIARKLPLEQASNAQRAQAPRGGSTLNAGQGRGGVDLRGQQGGGQGGCC